MTGESGTESGDPVPEPVPSPADPGASPSPPGAGAVPPDRPGPLLPATGAAGVVFLAQLLLPDPLRTIVSVGGPYLVLFTRRLAVVLFPVWRLVEVEIGYKFALWTSNDSAERARIQDARVAAREVILERLASALTKDPHRGS